MTGAVLLSFGAAIALGLARFSYALLLPPMKLDLGWSFAQAGALNTGNAVGYLAGALAFPLLARHLSTSRLFQTGCLATTALMALAGCTATFEILLVQRIASGFSSAVIFVAGGLLAARLAAAHPRHSSRVLGLYYGGVGWGVVASALVVPWALGKAGHGWQGAWLALAGACAMCTVLAWHAAGSVSLADPGTGAVGQKHTPPQTRRMAHLLAAYGLFGVGYIGYMTFIIALLRGAGVGNTVITEFYITLGLATAASGLLWSRVLDHARGGGAFAFFCVLLSAATLGPAVTRSPLAIFASGIVFGATFLAVVASTTSFVRHNLSRAQWSAGISLFTVAFALGQIFGPVIMGRIADHAGLSRGFMCSAAVLLLAAALAIRQNPLPRTAYQA